MKRQLLLILIAILILSACSTATTATGDIEVHSAWARPTAQGNNAAVYLVLHNHSKTNDMLTGISSNVADAIEIHESKMVNDVMQMKMLNSLPVASGDEIIFEPGGTHIMLVSVKKPLALGEHIGIILHFKNHADIVADVQIDDTMPADDHADH